MKNADYSLLSQFYKVKKETFNNFFSQVPNTNERLIKVHIYGLGILIES